jgi:hypothetical protein
MPSITLRISQDLYERLQVEARTLDRDLERELGEAPARRSTPQTAAVQLLTREFDRRDDRARRARAARRPVVDHTRHGHGDDDPKREL